jgi:NDP-sugar pyrophosphorylase family protein
MIPTPTLILAGGLGTRLRAIIGDLPKPMAPVAGRPFLEYQIAALRAQGLTDIVLSVGYRHELIAAHFGDGSAFGVRIACVVEDRPLGTGGAVRLAAATMASLRARAACLILNGDTYFEADFNGLIGRHLAAHAPATLALIHVPDAGRYGSVALDPAGVITGFAEKGGAGAGLINAGAYAVSPAFLGGLPPEPTPLSLERDVFPALAERGQLRGVVMSGLNIDIGVPDSYARFDALMRLRAGEAPA